jgi:hypothetical protein
LPIAMKISSLMRAGIPRAFMNSRTLSSSCGGARPDATGRGRVRAIGRGESGRRAASGRDPGG